MRQKLQNYYNSIIYNNSPDQLTTFGDGIVSATYSDIQNGWPGLGNLKVDPLFVPDAYYLQSVAGHFDPYTDTWISAPVTSPCIDTGDPNAWFNLEPEPNGGRMNMGAYGGTEQASKTPVD